MVGRLRVRAAVAAVLCCAASTLWAEVTINRDGGKLKRLEITTGKGKGALVMVPAQWQNTTALTESGKKWRLIDPFMYQFSCVRDGKTIGGYMNKPDVFATWQAEQIKDPARPNAEILRFAVEPAGMGARKDVIVTVEKGANVAYVFNRITALRDMPNSGGHQYYYFGKPQDCKIYIDGKQIDLDAAAPDKRGKKQWPVNEYFCQYNPAAKVTYAVVFLNRDAQKYPGSGKRSLGHYDVVKNGGHLYWTKSGGKMNVGDTRWQQYVLVWGDGNLKDQVASLAKQAQAGELEAKVYRPAAK